LGISRSKLFERAKHGRLILLLGVDFDDHPHAFSVRSRI
jgi:hypothetical protein